MAETVVDLVTTDMPCGGKRGRPAKGTEAARRAALLQAAEDIFLAQGFGASSMEMVAKRAGISKKTIYCFFPTKEDLFAAMMKDRVEHSLPPDLPEDVTCAGTLEATLVHYLTELARVRLVPFVVNLTRLVIAEAPRFPEIARTYYREGPQRQFTQVAEWLQRQVDKGLIVVDDPAQAARVLVAPIVGEPLRTLALGVEEYPTIEVMAARAKTVARLFMRGCLPPKKN
jgi:AcrR family transcriptional regulator